MRIVTFFLLILGLCSCGMPANRPVDAFVWDRLCAHEDPDCVEPVGTCDADGFLAEMERFPWHEQAREALKLRKNSPHAVGIGFEERLFAFHFVRSG